MFKRLFLLLAMALGGAGLAVTALQAAPNPSHPRLWLTTNDLPRLRSLAMPGNPVYQQGLVPLLNQVLSDYNNSFFPGGVASTNYPDFGDTQGYSGLLSEEDAMVLAFHSLIDPNPAARSQYAQAARNLVMHAMNAAALGHLSGAPFRDRQFAIYNRANATGPDWPLVIDWIYNATDTNGNPVLSAQDKLTIQNVFLQWANDCLNASTTGGDHPDPIGVTNNLQLLPGGSAYRMTANNYYLGHARLLTMMALCLDPADDPPVSPGATNVFGNTLRSYLGNATGAWLFQQYAMYGDKAAVIRDYGLAANAGVGLASGGLPPEGFLYGHSYGFLLGGLLALRTAGYDDPALCGPQIGLIGAPMWDRFVDGFLASLTPDVKTSADEPWLQTFYQMDNYGDVLRLYVTPDFVQPFALLGLLDQQRGVTNRLNAERWMAIDGVEGGAGNLIQRVAQPQTWGDVDAIFYFLLLDPAAAAPTDPRPALPLAFYDPPAGRLIDRTDWTTNATTFDFRCSWRSINHQNADGGQFEFYRKREWLTKEVSNYDNNNQGETCDYHNTLSLQNACAAGIPQNLEWFEGTDWVNGSQWPFGESAGDPVAAASSTANYSFAFGDLTPMYNRPSQWTPTNAAMDILHASRSILWLKPDHVVVYDRATSRRAGRFKHFNLALVTAPTIQGNLITETTPGGQHLFITSLLPTNGSRSIITIGNALNPMAEEEPSRYRLVVKDAGNPADIRFLHVLQGADPGANADVVTAIHSSAGTPFDGAVVADAAVMFPVDVTVPVTGLTYMIPSGVTNHYLTGLAPNGGYDVSQQNGRLSVSPNGSTYRADTAGVLYVSSGAAAGAGPLLSAQPLVNGGLMLLWPVGTSGFQLESATTLAGPWTPVTQPVIDSGAQHTVSVTPTNSLFFRLVSSQ